MITNNCFNVRSLVLISAVVTGLGLVKPANAQSYLVDLNSRTATRLGTLGGSFSGAQDINDVGQVVGSSETAEGQGHAFITGPDGKGMRDLGTLGGRSVALSINDAGQVAGYFQTGDKRHAFITGPDGKGMRDLGTLGGSESSASGINNAGQVVGGSYTEGDRHFHAFITGPEGKGMRDLLAPTGDPAFGTARSINDAGQVAGVFSAEGPGHAFITGPDGMGMRDLGASGSSSSDAWDINDAGQVVGQDDGSHRAFITGPDGIGMRDLGTLGGMFPFNSSEALGINDAGQVVGRSFATVEGVPAFHAFVTGPDGTGMMDLNSLVEPPQGLIFWEARAINNAGQIIATTSVRPIPEPEIPALFLVGLGLIGFMARRKKAKNPE